jgi:hypothetical protein
MQVLVQVNRARMLQNQVPSGNGIIARLEESDLRRRCVALNGLSSHDGQTEIVGSCAAKFAATKTQVQLVEIRLGGRLS